MSRDLIKSWVQFAHDPWVHLAIHHKYEINTKQNQVKLLVFLGTNLPSKAIDGPRSLRGTIYSIWNWNRSRLDLLMNLLQSKWSYGILSILSSHICQEETVLFHVQFKRNSFNLQYSLVFLYYNILILTCSNERVDTIKPSFNLHAKLHIFILPNFTVFTADSCLIYRLSCEKVLRNFSRIRYKSVVCVGGLTCFIKIRFFCRMMLDWNQVQ